MFKKASFIVGIVVALYLLAFVAPGAITGLSTAETNNRTNTFVASDTDDGQFIFTLDKTPIVPNSETITLNATPIATTTYDINYTTGFLGIDIDPATTGDDVVATYVYNRNLTALWPVLAVIAVLALAYVVFQKTGLLRS
jgi:hypothetical protein